MAVRRMEYFVLTISREAVHNGCMLPPFIRLIAFFNGISELIHVAGFK